MAAVTIRIITETHALADMFALYQEAGWWQPDDDLDTLPALIRNAFAFAAAFDGEQLIGMGRALSDGVSDAYIQDVTVRESYRGQGIGKRLVAILIQTLQERGITWIGLIAQPGSASFYAAFGFKPMADCIPMRLVLPQPTPS